MRIVLFTGKGGVGKTTVAAATALATATAGRRTLVLSTDPAHSLADAFDQPLGSDPTELADRLYGQQLDATERLEEVWGDATPEASASLEVIVARLRRKLQPAAGRLPLVRTVRGLGYALAGPPGGEGI